MASVAVGGRIALIGVLTGFATLTSPYALAMPSVGRAGSKFQRLRACIVAAFVELAPAP